ncbi:hypothetical protein ACVWY3_007687 [Bradyrhizobium sp. USDA 4486]
MSTTSLRFLPSLYRNSTVTPDADGAKGSGVRLIHPSPKFRMIGRSARSRASSSTKSNRRDWSRTLSRRRTPWPDTQPVSERLHDAAVTNLPRWDRRQRSSQQRGPPHKSPGRSRTSNTTFHGDAALPRYPAEHADQRRPFWTPMGLLPPSSTQGPMMPYLARSATTRFPVVMRHGARRRSPRLKRPCVRAILVDAQVSHMKTRRSRSTLSWLSREPRRPSKRPDGLALRHGSLFLRVIL